MNRATSPIWKMKVVLLLCSLALCSWICCYRNYLFIATPSAWKRSTCSRHIQRQVVVVRCPWCITEFANGILHLSKSIVRINFKCIFYIVRFYCLLSVLLRFNRWNSLYKAYSHATLAVEPTTEIIRCCISSSCCVDQLRK